MYTKSMYESRYRVKGKVCGNHPLLHLHVHILGETNSAYELNDIWIMLKICLLLLELRMSLVIRMKYIKHGRETSSLLFHLPMKTRLSQGKVLIKRKIKKPCMNIG